MICATRVPDSVPIDVSGAVVDVAFRAQPWNLSKDEQERTHASIMFVGECNVCRSVLAEAILQKKLAAAGLAQDVHVESRATQDYNVGESPEAATLEAATRLGLSLAEDFQARVFDHRKDIALVDLVLVFDKFTASDLLREVTVYDTIFRDCSYAAKVQHLGRFHPDLSRSNAADGMDIGDPLYGNTGGEDEVQRVLQAAAVISESCDGLVAFLKELPESASLHESLSTAVQGLAPTDWLVPPLLQSKSEIHGDDADSFI